MRIDKLIDLLNWAIIHIIIIMRMRRKNNLEERIRASIDYLLAYEGQFRDVNLFIKDKDYINYPLVFNNSNRIELDLGCGLGGFIVEKAKQNRDVNFIGVEMFSNIIISAIDKARSENLSNLKFINCRIECLEKYIMENSISTIYLNFSNPLPNKTDEKQRLTSKRFLDIYKKILRPNGKIIQKTDNLDFFEFSCDSFKKNGWDIANINYDLENNKEEGNILTEHEIKYMLDGRKIYKLEAINVK